LSAQEILKLDPNLQQVAHSSLAYFFEVYKRTAKWGRIS
jgi:hypothetical protein